MLYSVFHEGSQTLSPALHLHYCDRPTMPIVRLDFNCQLAQQE